LHLNDEHVVHLVHVVRERHVPERWLHRHDEQRVQRVRDGVREWHALRVDGVHAHDRPRVRNVHAVRHWFVSDRRLRRRGEHVVLCLRDVWKRVLQEWRV
jgi:hypothetical protein